MHYNIIFILEADFIKYEFYYYAASLIVGQILNQVQAETLWPSGEEL